MSSKSNQFDELCRTCAKKSYNMQSLFDDGAPLAEMLYLCSQIKITQQINRPSQICCECAQKLEQAYEFHESVKNSERVFQEMFTIPNDWSVETAEIKMELQHLDNTIENDSIADMNDVIADIREEEEEDPTEYDSLETNLPIKKQPKQTIITSALETKSASVWVGKPSKKRYPDRSFECYRCRERFSSHRKTSVHLKKVHYDAEKFNCNICGARFVLLDDYNRHLCQGTSIACSYCNESFDTTVALVSHLDHSHDEKTLFKCPKCAQFYSMELLKQIHMQQHIEVESEDSKPYGCDMCEKRFSSRMLILKHRESHSEKRRFLCFECGKSFKTASSLYLHRIGHKEKTIQCPDCPMTFNRMGCLRRHRDIHMNLKYKCNLCHAELASKVALNAHTRKHSRTEDDKRHCCTFCPMKFFKKDKLTSHIRTHTGEKPFKCTMCPDRAYAQKGDLTKHMKLKHVGDKFYKCDLCAKGFKYYADLKAHSFEHYKEEKAKQATAS